MTEDPKLLPDGGPKIPTADGEEPVQDFIAAMPGWRCDIGRRIDRVISATVIDVRKAVKWNSPFYGPPGGRNWILSLHCYQNFVRVTFYDGAVLRPPPPVASKIRAVRYYDVREGALDEAQLAAWVEQAAALPGWTP